MQHTLWQNLIYILKLYRWRFLKAFLMILVSNALLIINPLILRQAIQAMGPTDVHASFMSTIFGSSLSLWITLLITLAFISSFFKYRMRVAFISVSRDAEMEVRSKLFSRIQDQSMAFFDRHGVGDLLSRLTNDISVYRDVLGPGIMYPLFFLTLVIPGLCALFSISPMLATVSLIPVGAIPLLNLLMRGKIYLYSKIAQQGLGDLSDMTQEHYSGVRIVKGYVCEGNLKNCFAALSQSLIHANIKLNTLQGLLYPFFVFLTRLVTLALVISFGIIVLKAWSQLGTADFVSFMWIQSYIYFPILMLGWVLPIYARGKVSYDRLVEIYEEPIEVKNPTQKDVVIPKNADIEFKHLTFHYPKTEKKVLQDFSLYIKGGTRLGITGPVGAGKSTIFRLLNREYEVPHGTLFIAGKEVHQYPLEAFGKEMITVEQMPFLFSRTIAENVRFGKAEALQSDIEMVARYADLHDTVLEFPQQYDTLVGERGVTLSGGQKQRIAMARAFLVDRSIILLDDIFSAVDASTETKIFLAIQKNFPIKTILLITHRASVLEAMDRVIFMQDGKILEDGSPEDLKAKKGHYAALIELQKVMHHDWD